MHPGHKNDVDQDVIFISRPAEEIMLPATESTPGQTREKITTEIADAVRRELQRCCSFNSYNDSRDLAEGLDNIFIAYDQDLIKEAFERNPVLLSDICDFPSSVL